jgi:hypothetical protein
MTDPLIEAMAIAIAPHLEGGRDFDRMPCDKSAALVEWLVNGETESCASQDDAREAAQAALSVVKQHLTSAVLDVRARNAGNFERNGAVWEAYDKAVLDCHAAITAALEGNEHE